MKSQNTSFPGRILSRITRQAPSVSACLQPSHSAQASLRCPALSNCKRIRKNPYLEQGAGPEEGRAGGQGQHGRGKKAGAEPCPALAQLHARNTGLTGLPSKTQKGEDTATPVNCRVKGQGIPLFFSPPRFKQKHFKSA